MNSIATLTPDQKIGAALKLQVLRHGRSIASVATVLGRSRSSIYRRVHGETLIKVNEVCAVAPHLGMEPGDLLLALKPTSMQETRA